MTDSITNIDISHDLNCKDKWTPIKKKPSQWLVSDTEMYIYEDPLREQTVREMIENHGAILFERSSEVLPAIRKKYSI